MEEAAVRRLLLARACEEADPGGSFVSQSARDRAARAAHEAFGREPTDSAEDAERYLSLRAEHLLGETVREHPALTALANTGAWVPPVWCFGALGVALGFGLDALGTARGINLLAFPLLGILLWNVVVIVVQGLSAALGRSAGGMPPWILRVWHAIRQRAVRTVSAGDAGFGVRASARFGALWLAAARALEMARVRLRLHVGATCFALGVVLAMYVGGFAFEYAATWESTFLDAPGVHRFLGFVLGPASILLGLPIPDVAGIAQLRAPGSGDAAPWIHRWALTALLFVGVPRLALVAYEASRVGRLAGRLGVDLGAAPYARQLSAFRGEGEDVRVLPYSVELRPVAAARLHELLHELFGSRADFAFEAPLAYGDEPPPLGERSPRATVVVFHLAQSPEREVHGVFIEELRAQLPDSDGNLLLILDESRYREVASPERADERRRAWDRVLADVGVRAVPFGPEVAAPDLLEGARAVLGPKARRA